MTTSMAHQKEAVKAGYWPLYRYRPGVEEHEHPFQLDSAKPSIPLKEFALKEARYAMLARTDPRRSEELIDLAQQAIDERWRYYEQLVDVERTMPHLDDHDEHLMTADELADAAGDGDSTGNTAEEATGDD